MPADVESVLTVTATAGVVSAGAKIARLYELAAEQANAPTMTAAQLAAAVRRICEVGTL